MNRGKITSNSVVSTKTNEGNSKKKDVEKKDSSSIVKKVKDKENTREKSIGVVREKQNNTINERPLSKNKVSGKEKNQNDKVMRELQREEVRHEQMIKKIEDDMNRTNEEMKKLMDRKKQAEMHLQKIIE